MDIETRVRQLLLPVFYLSSIDEVKPQASLVKDLGAESLDFVQMIYLIEKEFGVTLKPDELMSGGLNANPESLFLGGKLTREAAVLLNEKYPGRSETFTEGMTKNAIYLSITVGDLAAAVKARLERVETHA